MIGAPRQPTKRRDIVKLTLPGVRMIHIKFMKLNVHKPNTISHFACVPNARVMTLYSCRGRHTRGYRGCLGRTSLPGTTICSNSGNCRRLYGHSSVSLICVTAS